MVLVVVAVVVTVNFFSTTPSNFSFGLSFVVCLLTRFKIGEDSLGLGCGGRGGGAVLVETAVIDIGLERLEFRGVDMVWRGEGMTVKSHPEMTR